MATVYSDPFTNPDTDQLIEKPAERVPVAARSRMKGNNSFDPEIPWTVNDPSTFNLADDGLPTYQSPYAGEDLLSEPKDPLNGPTAFQRKEINWSDGGENPDEPKAFPDAKSTDFLEVDYLYGSKKGASKDPILAANVFGRQISSEELARDEEGRRLLDLMRIRREGSHNDGGTIGNFVKGFTDWSQADIPFYGWVADVGASASEAIDMSNTMKKLQNGERVTKHEAIQLRRFMLQQELESQHTMARDVGSLTRQAVSFGAEMAASAAIGAALGSVIPGPGTAIGAIIGGALAPLRWIFGIGGKASRVATRRVIDKGLQDLSKKAVSEWTRGEARTLLQSGVKRYGRDGLQKFMSETMARVSTEESAKGLGRRALRNRAFQELAGELSLEQYSAKKLASRTLLSADYRQFLEQGMKQGIAEQALKRAGVNDVSKFLGKNVVMDRRLLREFDKAMSKGLKILMKEDGGKTWKAYVEGISKGIVQGEWANGKTAQDLVRKGISEVVGNGEFISPRLAKGVADQVAKTVARNMELRYGNAAFRNAQRLWNYVAEHATRGFLQSEHAFGGMAPTIAHNGFSSFVRSSDALKEGIGRLFIQAPIQGAKNFITGPLLVDPLVAMASGTNPQDLVVRGQLGLQLNALLTGDRKNMDSARSCALGSAFVEYISESAGRGLGITLKGLAGLGTSVKAATAGAESVLGPISRKTGAILDRAVTAVFGKDAFGTREGLINKATAFLSKRLKAPVPTADIRRAITAKSLEGLSDAAKRALARDGIKSYNGLLRAVSRDAMNGNRFAALRAYIGAKLAERGASPDEIVRKFRQFGYDGILEEMGEERYGDLIRGLFALDDSASDAEVSEHVKRAFSGFTDYEQLATEFIGFAIPGGIRHAAISSQRWLATGAIGRGREAIDRINAVRDAVRYGTATAHVEDDVKTNKARARHDQKVAAARDAALGSTEDNTKAFSSNIKGALDAKQMIASGSEAAVSNARSEEEREARLRDQAAVADIVSADSELQMKTALEAYASGLLECETETILDDTISRQNATQILGEDGVAAVRREWRKRNGHEFDANGQNAAIEASLTEWKRLNDAGYEAELAEVENEPISEDEAAQSVYVQASTRTNASLTAEQEDTAGQGEASTPFVDTHTRDVMTDDIMEIGRLMGRALTHRQEKLSLGRRVASRVVGLISAMATGDLSLAAQNPALWLAQDRGLDPTITRYATDAYQAAMLQGFRRVMAERSEDIKSIIGDRNITDVASLREALDEAYDKGKLRADIYDQIEAAGEETFRRRSEEFATAYMAAHGIMLFSRQDSENIAKKIVAGRRAAQGQSLDETADRDEIEEVRRTVVDKVIDIVKNATGVTSHAGQGQYGTFVTIDVRRAIQANDNAELVSAILDSPAFRGASKLVDVSRLSEHDRENAMSLLCTNVANLNAIRRIDPEATEDLTEEQLSIINEGMRINLSDYTPDEVQSMARQFVRRVRLLSENMRKSYSKTDDTGHPLKAVLSPIGQGQYEVVLTDETGARIESGVENGTHDQVEAELLASGFVENEQKLVISGLSSVVSSDATSLVFFRAGQDREEVRRQFIRAQGEGLTDTTVDEDRLPPYCRKKLDESGRAVWVYSDNELEEAVNAFRQELDLANEFEAKSAYALKNGKLDKRGETWKSYLKGFASSVEARKARENECFAAWVKVYGENGIGYERCASRILTDLGIHRNTSLGTNAQMIGLANDAWRMNMDAIQSNDICVLSPNYATLGHGEAMLRFGLRNAFNSYVTGSEAEGRGALLAKAASEFRDSAIALADRLDKVPEQKEMARRIRQTIDELLPARDGRVTTQALAAIVSSSVFFSCDRGDFGTGNGFLRSVELSMIADEFRARPIFQLLFSATDEALGGNGCYSTVASAEGIARWLYAFAPEATALAKARSSQAFSGVNPYISGLSVKAVENGKTLTAADFESGSALQVATDLGISDGGSYRVRAFNGKLVHRENNGSVGGYLLELAQGAHRLARQYGEITSQKDVVLSAAQVFHMASDALGLQATEAGGDTADTGTRASFRGIVVEDPAQARTYRAVASYKQRTTTEGVSDSAKELFGHALRNIADTFRQKDVNGTKFKREVSEWLKGMAVPKTVVDSFVAAFDDVNENAKPLEGQTKNEEAKRQIDEDAELERENSTNDADHERRTAAFANDPDIRSLSEVLRYVFPFERGDSAPTVLRLREAFSDPAVYEGLSEADTSRIRNLFAIAANLQNFDDSVSADEQSRQVSEQHDAEFDAMLRRVVGGLWKNGHKDLSLALAAIVSIPARDGRRGKLLSMLGQAFTVGSLELHEDAMANGFRVVLSGSNPGYGTIRTLMGVSYSSLLTSKLFDGFADPVTGQIKDVRVLAKLIKNLAPRTFYLTEGTETWNPSWDLRVNTAYSEEKDDGHTIDASVDVPLLDSLMKVMSARDTSNVNRLDWYATVEKAGAALRDKMEKAAAVVDRIFGPGNQYSFMLRQPFTAGRIIQEAKSAIDVKPDPKVKKFRRDSVYDLINLLNYFSASKTDKKSFSTQDTQVLEGSRFLNDILREPILGLYRVLGGDPVKDTMTEDDIAAKLEKGLESVATGKLSGYSQMDALRAHMQDLALLKSQRSDLHLDAGLSLKESFENLGISFEPSIGSTKRSSPYATLVSAYIAGSPRTSATMSGRSVTREESAKQKSVQTLPSALPGFVRFVNSPLFKVGGADAAYQNGFWSDGSRPVVSFVGAKIERGHVYERQALGGYVLQAIRDQFKGKGNLPSHILFPFFRADKPACYAIQVPVGIVQNWVRAYWDAMEKGDSDLLDALPPGVRKILEAAHEAAREATTTADNASEPVRGFHDSNNKPTFLSNFFDVPVTVDGHTYRNAEAAFQAQKSEDPAVRVAFESYTAAQAKAAGRKVLLRKDWEAVKQSVMESVVAAKFEQNPALMKQLVATGNRELVEENTWGDRTWGVVNGKGENRLGKILMGVRQKAANAKKSTGLSKDGFYDVAYALVASALGQSQIDPKRVPVLSSVGPYISGWANDGEKTDPRAGVYIVSTVGGTTGASLMGGYLTSGLMPTRVASYGEGRWSQAQKVHMFDVVNGVNFKKGQATSMGKTVAEQIGATESGEVLTSNALRYAQEQMRRAYERIAGLRNGVLDPVAPKTDAQTDEEYDALVKEHDAAVAAVEELGKILTVMADDLETNKAGIFGSSCGLKPVGNQVVVNGVVLAEYDENDEEWHSRVPGFSFDWGGEGIKKGKALIAVALSAYAVATGESFDASTIEGTWIKPDGSEFTGKLSDSGLLKPGETLNFSAEKGADFATMEFKTRSMHAQVVASNATSSKAEADHAFPTNATRDHWMIESIINSMPLDAEGGVTGADRKTRKPSRRFLDAHAGYSLLALASIGQRGNDDLIYRALAGDEELADLFKKHPYDPELRDTYSAKIRAYVTKAAIVNFYGNHGVMVPSGFKVTSADEFGHIVKIEEAKGINDYDRGCYKPPVVYTTAQRAAFGCPRSYGSGSVNANVPGFRYGWYMDEEAFDALVNDIQIDESRISAFQLCGYEYGDCERLLKLEGYLRKHQGNLEMQRKLADAFFDYTGRHASGSAYAKSVRFDDLFFEKDGELVFDYAAFDLDKRADKDKERRLYLGGSIFHAHRSPSGNIAAASGTVRATCPRSYNAKTGAVGVESAYALDPVTTHNQGSDMDGDSASLQFYDYECGDNDISFKDMNELTQAALDGKDVFQFAKEHGWTKTVSERGTNGKFVDHEVIDPSVLRKFARGVFIAQVLNYREMPVFHQGYANGLVLPGGTHQDVADGSWFADRFASGEAELDAGWVFTDFGFAGRHPVGTDAVFAEPVTADSRSRLTASGIGTKTKSLIQKALDAVDSKGKPKNKTLKDVFEACVSEVNGKPKQNMVVPEETAGMSDAASDSAKARGIGVSNQSLFTRALVTRFADIQARNADGTRATRAVDPDGYSPVIDLVAHLDGISNNLFDTLKKMFATGAGWTTTLLPQFIGRLVYNAPNYDRLDSVFVLREAVSFLLEAKTEGTVLWNLDKLTVDRPSRDTIQRAAEAVKAAAKAWEQENPGMVANLPMSSDLKDWVDAFSRFTKIGYKTVAKNEKGKPVLVERYDKFHSTEVELARRMSTMAGKDKSAALLDVVASASDAIRELSSGTDYMKMSGADTSKLDRVLDRESKALNDRVDEQTLDTDSERDELRLQQLVVNQMADTVSERTVTEDEIEQYVRDISTDKFYNSNFTAMTTMFLSRDFASGSLFRDNLERLVHLVGFWRNTTKDVRDLAYSLSEIHTKVIDTEARDEHGNQTLEKTDEVTRTTDGFMKNLGSVVRQLSDRALMSTKGVKGMLDNRESVRFFLANLTADSNGIVSLSSKVSAADIEALRQGFMSLRTSSSEITAAIDGRSVTVTGRQLAELLMISAAIGNPFGATKDYAGLSNLAAVFPDAALADAESLYPEIIRNPVLRDLCGHSLTKGSRVFDLFGYVRNNGAFAVNYLLSKQHQDALRKYRDTFGPDAVKGLQVRGAAKGEPYGTVRVDTSDDFTGGGRDMAASLLLNRDNLTLRFPGARNGLAKRKRHGDKFLEKLTDYLTNKDRVVKLTSLKSKDGSKFVLTTGTKVPNNSANLIDPQIGSTLDTDLSFRDAEGNELPVFKVPHWNKAEVDEKTGKVVKPGRLGFYGERSPVTRSLEDAYHQFLGERIHAETDDANVYRAALDYYELNYGNRTRYGSDVGEVSRDLSRIIASAALRDHRVLEALSMAGQYPIETGDELIDLAFDKARKLVEAEQARRAAVQAGKANPVVTDSGTRASFVVRAEELYPGFTQSGIKSASEAVKAAFEAIPGTKVESVLDRDGNPTNLLKVVRTIKGKRVITYVSLGSRMGDTLGADAIAESLANSAGEWVDGVTSASLKAQFGENALKRIGRLMAETGGQRGESVVGGFDFAPAMSGLIRLDASADFNTLFHEYYHQMVACYRKLGILDGTEEDRLNTELGGEEAAADAFARYLTGVENNTDTVKLREFVDPDGKMSEESHALMARLRTVSANIAQGLYRGDDEHGLPQFIRTKILEGELTDEEAAKIAEPSAEDVENLEKELIGKESTPRTDIVTSEQMIKLMDLRQQVLMAIAMGDLTGVAQALDEAETILTTNPPREDTRKPRRVVVTDENKEPIKIVRASDVASVSAFIRKALDRYGDAAKTQDVSIYLEKFRHTPVGSDSAFDQADAKYIYTVRRFIRYVAGAEGILIENEDGTLTESGKALLQNETVAELAMRLLDAATYERERIEAGRDNENGPEFSSADFAFARAIEFVAPASYGAYCRKLASDSARQFKTLAAAIRSNPNASEKDRAAAADFERRAELIVQYTEIAVTGGDFSHLLRGDFRPGEKPWGLLFRQFTGAAQFDGDRPGQDGILRYDREKQHFSFLSTDGSVPDPAIDLAYDYAAQALFVAMCGRSYRLQVEGIGKGDNWTNEEYLESLGGPESLANKDPMGHVADMSDDAGQVVAQELAETLNLGPTAELAAGLARGPKWSDPSAFYSYIDTTDTTPEWILANEGSWLSADMMENLGGVGLREMMTDHTVQAATESKYRLAVDWIQFFGLDTHVGDGVRKLAFVESNLGRDSQGDFEMSKDPTHTAMQFSQVNGCLFGILNWQEARHRKAITEEDWQNLHMVGRLVKTLASGDDRELTGITVDDLSSEQLREKFTGGGWTSWYSPAAVLARRANGDQMDAVDAVLLRMIDSVDGCVLFSTENKDGVAARENLDPRGLYSEFLNTIAVAMRKCNGVRGPGLHGRLVDELARAGLVHKGGAAKDRVVVCITTDRMYKAWNGSATRKMLQDAGRPSAMLNPYYWANKFSKAVAELNRVAAKSSYLSNGIGSTMSLAGTNQFWFHGGTGAHKAKVNAYQNAIEAFAGLTPSDTRVLEAKQTELFEILKNSSPETLRARAFAPNGNSRLTQTELKYLATLLGIVNRQDSATFDANAFAKRIARGALEVPVEGIRRSIRRDASVGDIRLMISDLVIEDIFSATIGKENRQDLFDQMTVAEMLRDRLTSDMPGTIVARSALREFESTGRLGDSRTAAEALIQMCKDMTTAERFRGCLAQMLTSVSADGMPNYIVDPTDEMVAVNRIPDEYWGALARHVIKFSRVSMPAYDAALSGVENMHRVYEWVTKSASSAYGSINVDQYGASRMFKGILCRLDDRDVAGNVNVLTRVQGGEAACYMKQLLSSLHAPTQTAGWRIIDRVVSWSKISSVGFSAFFQIATAFESPTAATGFLHALGGQAEWLGKAIRRVTGKGSVFTRDVVKLLNSNDPFITQARELCALIGMPLDSAIDFQNSPTDGNPVLGNAVGVKKDIERMTDMATALGGAGLGRAVRKVLDFQYRHPTDYTFNVVLNGVKLAVVMHTMHRLREECLAGSRPFDPVRELRKYAPYINAEIGGIDPARYAWATPVMRKYLSAGMFSWQWTAGAWSAGGGEAITDIVFGGHSTNPEMRRHAFVRWLRMLGIVKFGVPLVLHMAIKAFSKALMAVFPPPPDDEDGQSLRQEIEDIPWFAWENESKAGMMAFDVTPLLKLAGRIPGVKEAKRSEVPAWVGLAGGALLGMGLGRKVSASTAIFGAMTGASIVPTITPLIPAYVGGGRNSTGKRKYYMHFGKQSDEFFRWFDDPLAQFASKLSIPIQKTIEGFYGRSASGLYAKGFADLGMFERWANLTMDPEQSALWNLISGLGTSFSRQSVNANPDAGFLAAIGPMRMGQSKRSTRLRIVSRLRDFVEDDRSNNPWSYSKNRRKLNLLCTDILKEAQLNGVDPSTILTSALGDIAKAQYLKLFRAFPPSFDAAPDVKAMREAIRALTRCNRKYQAIKQNLVQKFRDAGTDVKKNPAMYKAALDVIHATQVSPMLYTDEMAADRFDASLTSADRQTRSMHLDEKGGEGFTNFLATDEVPETLFGVPIVTDGISEEDAEFFKTHPEAGGFYDLGEK